PSSPPGPPARPASGPRFGSVRGRSRPAPRPQALSSMSGPSAESPFRARAPGRVEARLPALLVSVAPVEKLDPTLPKPAGAPAAPPAPFAQDQRRGRRTPPSFAPFAEAPRGLL